MSESDAGHTLVSHAGRLGFDDSEMAPSPSTNRMSSNSQGCRIAKQSVWYVCQRSGGRSKEPVLIKRDEEIRIPN